MRCVKYAESDDFQILLFGYSVDGGEVQVIDLASGEAIPEDVLAALTNDDVTKWAFNANFERVCLSRHLADLGVSLDPFHDQHPLSKDCARFLNPAGWRCTMVWSAYLGLPLSLAGAGTVLGLDNQKMTEGKDLIKYFCQPFAPSKSKDGRSRNLPSHDRQKWETFKAYNARDVETEMAIQHRLRNYPVPEDVWEQYHQDQEINDRGIALDMTLVENAIRMDNQSRNELTAAMQRLTTLENPNSVQQMKSWLADNGLETETLGKKAVAELLKDCPPELREVLLLRQQLAKSSVKKYVAMQNAVCADGRARGMFMFYGANRTGRFSGRLIQLQNLPQNKMPDLDKARQLVRSGDYDQVKLLYDDVPDTLSQLIRTAFVPAEGYKFVVSDFAAIEARVIAWLAGEEWRKKVFMEGGDIYCASASAMFHVPVVKHGVNGHLRQRGKVAELALGYGGSVGALKAMGALEMGVPEEELILLPDKNFPSHRSFSAPALLHSGQRSGATPPSIQLSRNEKILDDLVNFLSSLSIKPLVDAWRESNPNIVRLWWDVNKAVMEAVMDKSITETHGIQFECTSGMLFITLPSGRKLSYVKPQICTNQVGGDAITYIGIGSTKNLERQ